MRTVDIEIGGQTYPLCLTLEVYDRIFKRYGGIKECYDRLDEVAGKYEKDEDSGEMRVLRSEDTKALVDEYLWLTDQLMTGGMKRRYGSCSDELLPDLTSELSPGDIPYVQRKVLEAITAGQRREVGTAAQKNAEGADTGPAPEN